MNRLLFALFVLSLSLTSQAQNFKSWKLSDRYFSASIGTGAVTYLGELNYTSKINDRLSLLDAAIEARLLNRIGAKVNLSYFSLSGTDQNAPDSSLQRQRNLSFDSRNFLAQLQLVYYFKRYLGNYDKRWAFDPYLLSGIGYMWFQPSAELAGERHLLRPLQTEGVAYNSWVLTVPVGLGGKFKINEFVNLNVELTYHLAFTDYLDDVSYAYGSEFDNLTAQLLSNRKDEIELISPAFYDQLIPGSTRGNPGDDDQLFMISIKLEVFLPPNLFSNSGGKAIIKKPSY